jgi:hypothetical protein
VAVPGDMAVEYSVGRVSETFCRSAERTVCTTYVRAINSRRQRAHSVVTTVRSPDILRAIEITVEIVH